MPNSNAAAWRSVSAAELTAPSIVSTPKFRNHATNFRLSRIFVVANISRNPCDISANAEEVGWHVPCLIRGQKPCAGGLMSTFDNPFDPDRRLRAGGCSCGRHVSEAEHEQAALALRCEP